MEELTKSADDVSMRVARLAGTDMDHETSESSADEVAGLAEELLELVDRFKIDD